jgi:ribonuclease HII
MMKTIKEITTAYKEALQYEEWMDAFKLDERAAVQKAIVSFEKRMAKQAAVQQAHDEKLAFDASYLPHEQALLAGTDEAGRGPLAGPVVTAAVILPNYCQELLGINDSKQLSKEKRNDYAKRIKEHAIDYSIHFQWEDIIDEINILEASRTSMEASIEALEIKPEVVLADAMKLRVDVPQHSIIKGDAKSLAIAAASILAKTARDDFMDELDEKYPMYGFKQHAGYGTKQHLEAIEQYGITKHHRKTFEPIKSMIQKG